jgi:RNA polymerase sigma-70 factor, ECF subfamily
VEETRRTLEGAGPLPLAPHPRPGDAPVAVSARRPTSPEAALFEEMVTAHLDALYRTALRLTGRPQDAEDLVQETYLRAWRSLHTYRPGTNPKAWLFRILHNARIDQYRASTRAVQTVDEIEGQDPAFVVNETPESLVLAGVMDAEVRHALMDIPEVFRACVILADLEGFSYQEIADILGIPRGTVMSRLFRGRRAMRKLLARYGREHGYLKAN